MGISLLCPSGTPPRGQLYFQVICTFPAVFPPPALTICLSPPVTCVSLWSFLLCLLLLTKVTLVCQEASAHPTRGPHRVERNTSSLALGTQLTRLSVHSGPHWIKSLVALTPFAPSGLLLAPSGNFLTPLPPPRRQEPLRCSWLCDPFLAPFPLEPLVLSFLVSPWA